MPEKSILVVDAKQAGAAALAARLEARGHRVFTAVDAVQALTAYRACRPDLVVLAIDLPGGGGPRVQERIERLEGRPAPVVYLLDAAASPEARAVAEAHRPVDLVDRGDDVEAVADRIDRLVSAPPAPARPARGALRVLVVESDPGERDRLRASLQVPGREPMELAFAGSDREAVASLRSSRFECVVVADDLAAARGLDVLEAVDEELLTTPVVALLRGDDPAVAVEYFRAGCTACLGRAEATGSDALRRCIADAVSRFHRRTLATILERGQLGDAILESQEGLITLARTDRLMGICNRAVFDDYHPRFHADAAARGGTYALCMIDVDCFKAYNDAYGHAAGDDVLRRVAAAVATGLRADDFVARYGGEEIVVLIDGVDVQAAGPRADELRARVAACGLRHAGRPAHGRVTASVGVAACRPAEGETAMSVLLRADEALYLAKRGGRNRTVLAADPAPAGRVA